MPIIILLQHNEVVYILIALQAKNYENSVYNFYEQKFAQISLH